MKTPFLSIIIPAYNAADTIPVITSHILGQSFSDLELILVDDGSTDDTLTVIEKIKASDERVRVFSQKNAGPSAARNRGITAASGQYLIFFDADDDIDPTIPSTVATAAKKSGADLLVCGHMDVRHDRNVPVQPIAIELSAGDDIVAYTLRALGGDGTMYSLCSKLFRADIVRRHRIKFIDDLSFGEDLLFALEYIKHAGTLRAIPDILYYYNRNTTGSTFAKSSIIWRYRQINSDKLWDFAGRPTSGPRYDLATWVDTKWLISYCLCVCGARISLREKLKKLRPVTRRKTPHPAPGNRRLIYRLFWTLHRSTFCLFIMFRIVTLLRPPGGHK